MSTYTYNAAGRLVRAASVTATIVYTYTADGLRVAQDADGAVTAAREPVLSEVEGWTPYGVELDGALFLVPSVLMHRRSRRPKY